MKKEILLIILLFSLIFLIWGVSAAPNITSVTGNLSHGNTIIISGSGFGTKATTAPLLWDNFESGTNGQVITGKSPVVGSVWTTYTSGSTVPVYDSSIIRAGSTLSSRADYYLNPDYDVCLTKEVTITTGSELFFSYYWYYHKMSTNYPDNNKPWMVWGPGGLPMAYVGYGDPAASDGGSRDALEDDPMPSNTIGWGSTQLANLNDHWIRIDVYLKQSAPNTANGILKYWVDGVLDINKPNVITRTGNAAWDTILLGGFIRQNNPVQIYIDDVYIDTTPARIELCNGSTWNNRGNCEIQIPTAWNHNSINITINQGSFANGTTAYLFVVDSNGTASSGYTITISGQTQPPAINVTTMQKLLNSFGSFKSGGSLSNYILKIKEFILG